MSQRWGEEEPPAAGASFLRRDGSVWTTAKDGLILNLLAAEITALLTNAPGNDAPIGGLKVVTACGRFGARQIVADAPQRPGP